ncbi:MAG: SEC-C metal-binding domain-containing protein, partial [Candidatus Geothermincolia bacterium]
REVVYVERNGLLEGEDFAELARKWIEDTLESAIQTFTNAQAFPEDWDLAGLTAYVLQIFPLSIDIENLDLEGLTQEELREILFEDSTRAYAEREAELGGEMMRSLERNVMLEVVDNKWREHLYELDYLQEGIGLRGMAGRDPLIEYQSEAYEMFMSMLDSIKEEFARYIYHAQVVEVERERPVKVFESGASEEPAQAEQRHSDKTPRNAPCPCGSGKKYKKCCGANE